MRHPLKTMPRLSSIINPFKNAFSSIACLGDLMGGGYFIHIQTFESNKIKPFCCFENETGNAFYFVIPYKYEPKISQSKISS